MKAKLKQLELTTFVIDDSVYYVAPIEGYENYYGSTCGFIISTRHIEPRVLLGNETHNGYLRVKISPSCLDKLMNLRIHRLIAQTFYNFDPLDYKGNLRLEVNHINGVKTDNKVTNLEWCSKIENKAHFNSVTRVLQKLLEE
tara:strand:+ start:239 stop:664 length:426 start_codon:yes stop_codon:yes gene_type:complete